jgi:hypothetical protein
MLFATESETFTGEGDQDHLEDEADRFSDLYEHRTNIISQIELIDVTLAANQIDIESDTAFKETVHKTLEEIRETAKALVDLDKKNILVSEKLSNFLRSNLKKLRDGRGVNTAYTDPLHQASSGRNFDQKN